MTLVACRCTGCPRCGTAWKPVTNPGDSPGIAHHCECGAWWGHVAWPRRGPRRPWLAIRRHAPRTLYG
jgi:hypothetical protein